MWGSGVPTNAQTLKFDIFLWDVQVRNYVIQQALQIWLPFLGQDWSSLELYRPPI